MVMTKFAGAALGCAFLAAGAFAAGTAPASAADAGVAAPAGKSPWMIRLRGLAVLPVEDANLPAIPAGDAHIDNSVVPELDISYFFTENFALELILAVTPHDVRGRGALAGTNLGDVWLLPPTLLAQYHFHLTDNIKPYVGAGINYTIFFSEDSGPAFASVDYDNSFGVALQAGVDIMFDEHWGINFDVKKLFLDTDVTWRQPGAVRAKVDIDPWIIGGGLVYRF